MNAEEMRKITENSIPNMVAITVTSIITGMKTAAAQGKTGVHVQIENRTVAWKVSKYLTSEGYRVTTQGDDLHINWS